MKVKHELQITAKCPVSDAIDGYECIVETECFIQIEDILKAAEPYTEKQIYQEGLCTELAKAIGGDATVTLIGVHSNVKTTVTCNAYEG